MPVGDIDMNCMNMMDGMGAMGGMMMLAMGAQWLLFVVLAGLGIAALVKYLRTPSR